MGERTQKESKIIEDFEGINNLVDELKLSDEFTPWSHGGYYNEKAEFERIKGKKLNSSVTTGGHVLTLHQLEFTDRDVLFIHQSSDWKIESDLSELMTEPEITSLVPLEPFIF